MTFDALAEKYADRVTPEYRAAMQAVAIARLVLAGNRPVYAAFLASERHMHDVGGLLDPTLYRDMIYSKSFALQKRLVEAAVAFLDETDAVEREISAEKGA